MTVQEAKTYFQKLAQDAALSKEQQESILQAMDNEKFGKGLADGIKRHDEFSREMDGLRAEKQRLQNWYQNEELPKYNKWQQDADTLQKYQQLYGELDDQGLNNGNQSAPNRRQTSGVSKEDLDKYLADQFRQRDAAYVGLTKSTMKASHDHLRRFKTPLEEEDIDKIEKLALDRGYDFSTAYKEYIAPKIQAATDAQHKAEIEQAKTDAVRDYQSRMKLPLDARPKEAHPFYDRQVPDPKIDPLDHERNSKNEFMTGWNNYEQEMQKQGQT
jgi:hypothetical protein